MSTASDRVAARYLKAGNWHQQSYISAAGNKGVIVTLRATSPRPGVTVPFSEAEDAWKAVYQAAKKLAGEYGGKITSPVEILGVPKPSLQVALMVPTGDFGTGGGDGSGPYYLTRLGFPVAKG
jgi:hypothetical protein